MQTYNKIPAYENIFILSNGQFKCGDQSDESRIKFFKNDYKNALNVKAIRLK